MHKKNNSKTSNRKDPRSLIPSKTIETGQNQIPMLISSPQLSLEATQQKVDSAVSRLYNDASRKKEHLEKIQLVNAKKELE
jgi:hypothetical protein